MADNAAFNAEMRRLAENGKLKHVAVVSIKDGKSEIIQPKDHFRCQSCDDEFPNCIKTELRTEDPPYILCPNCLLYLVTNSLSERLFFNLLKNGHSTKEFYLHADFYDEETGISIQPKL